MHLRGLLISAVVFTLVATACQYVPAQFAAYPAFSECAGVPATIGIGWSETDTGSNTYYGTEGDDVVVITNGPVLFYGLGGDDLICINDTGLPWADSCCFDVIAGDGNDTVYNFSSVSDPEFAVIVELGSGNDRYEGGPVTEVVGGGSGSDRVSTRAGLDIIIDAGTSQGDRLDCGDDFDTYITSDAADPAFRNCEQPWVVPLTVG